MSKILITGANGFMGSRIAQRMTAAGHDVFCLVRRTSNLRRLEGLDITLLYGDITDRSSLPPAVADKEYIYHTAAALKAPTRKRFYEINVAGTQNLLETCLQNDRALQRLVFISSQAAAGPSRNGVPVKETDPPHPVSLYGWSKLEAEKVCSHLFDKLPISIIRPPVIYGPHDMALWPVFKLLKKGFRLNLGRQKVISFSYIEDVVDGAILAAEKTQAVGRTFNIASEKSYDWDHILKKAAEILHLKTRKLLIPPFLAMSYGYCLTLHSRLTGAAHAADAQKMRELLRKYWISDITLAKNILGYRPRHSLEEGLRKTLTWYRQQGWL